MARYGPCPKGCGWAAAFDSYFKRWRCFSCGWMPRSGVEAHMEVHNNRRRGGPFPRGAVTSVGGLAVGAEYEFLVEASRGRWVSLAIRAFAGTVEAHVESDKATIAECATPTGARREFTHQPNDRLPGNQPEVLSGATIQFWDGGAKDGSLAMYDVIGKDATFAVVPVSADHGARCRTDDNLRKAFGAD